MEKLLIILAFVLLPALSNWLKKRSEQSQRDKLPDSGNVSSPPRRPPQTSGPPPAAPRPRPAKAFDWEEELRRLLEGEAAPPIPPPSRPPPIIIEKLPPEPAPVPAMERREAPVAPPVRFPSPLPKPAAPVAQPVEMPARLAQLAEADRVYEEARQLPERVAELLHQVAEPGAKPAVTQAAELSDAAVGVRLLRNPHTVRQAFVASLVFGPPKSLE